MLRPNRPGRAKRHYREEERRSRAKKEIQPGKPKTRLMEAKP